MSSHTVELKVFFQLSVFVTRMKIPEASVRKYVRANLYRSLSIAMLLQRDEAAYTVYVTCRTRRSLSGSIQPSPRDSVGVVGGKSIALRICSKMPLPNEGQTRVKKKNHYIP